MTRPIDILFPDHSAKVEMGICPVCGNACGAFRDALSQREHNISGMCQECQDDFFGA